MLYSDYREDELYMEFLKDGRKENNGDQGFQLSFFTEGIFGFFSLVLDCGKGEGGGGGLSNVSGKN